MILIVNPFSGNGKAASSLVIIKNRLKQKGIEFEVKQTVRAKHALEIARDLDFSNYDLLMVCGGDGTLNEVINGLMVRQNADHPPIALIPGGTGNSVAVSMGIEDVDDAVTAAIEGTLRRVDLGKISLADGKVMYMCNLLGWGLGVDANVTAEELRCCGPCRYDLGAVWQIIKGVERRAKVNIDGEIFDDDFSIIMIQNNQHGGSHLRLAPFAKLDDGALDVLLAKNLGRSSNIAMFNELKRGGSHVYQDWVNYRRFRKLHLDSEPQGMLVNVDGENCGTTPLTVEVIKGSLLFCAKN